MSEITRARLNDGAGPGTRSYLRRRNSLSVLNSVWDTPRTIAEVARATGLSRTAAESVISDLVSLGWIAPEDATVGGSGAQPGRPAVRYRFARGVGYIAGVDIDSDHVSACVADLSGKILASARVPATENQPADERLELATETLRSVLERAGIPTAQIWAVAIATPGIVNGGQVIYFGGEGMPGWTGIDIAAAFTSRFSCPVLVGSDAALGALAEQRIGIAAGVSSIVFLLSGVRTGSSFTSGHRLHRGARGGAGLVGELAELRWRDLGHELYGSDVYPTERPSREAIFKLARDGDPLATKAAADFGVALALGASAMVLAVDPELVVIGGPFSRYADVFIDGFAEELARHCPLVPEIGVSTVGSDVVLEGSISLGLSRVRQGLEGSVELLGSFPAPSAALLAQLAEARKLGATA
jgi:predicted NBD/HSP70 family sugar kinase